MCIAYRAILTSLVCTAVRARGCAYLGVVHTGDWSAIHTVTVVVVACTAGGGAGQRPLSRDTPTGGLVQQGAATVKQVLRLPVLWTSCSRILDCLYASVNS